MVARARRPSPEFLRVTARALAREAIWWTCSRTGAASGRGILLFATRRGGSTWAMELIGSNRGVRSLNQPLETLSRNLTFAQAMEIPRYPQGQITSLDSLQADALEKYVGRLLDGQLVVNAPTRFWTREFCWSAERVVLKITDAKAVIGWFDETFDAQIVYFTRHPVAQSLSCMRNKWTITSEAYLGDPRFVENFLADSVGFCWDIVKGGSVLEKWVLNWALENIAPLSLLPARQHWLHVRYEDTVLAPDAELARLASKLELGDLDRMKQHLRRPSGSSGRSLTHTRGAIERGDASRALNGWRHHVDPAEVAASALVLERLAIDPGYVVSVW